jgi:hypothetical protein
MYNKNVQGHASVLSTQNKKFLRACSMAYWRPSNLCDCGLLVPRPREAPS